MEWIPGRRYKIWTTRGTIEAEIVDERCAIFAAEYKRQRWHNRYGKIEIGRKFDGGVVQGIRLNENVVH